MARSNRRSRYVPVMPFSVAMKLLIPTTTKVKGVEKRTYPSPADVSQTFNGSFRTFGGSEGFENDIYTVVDTATIDCWYDPNIKSDCRVYVCDTGRTYEVLGSPEDINMRHQYMRIRVRAIGS